MRITIVGINYSPELTGIAPYTTGLARGLAEHGHQVTVVTGLPHYPEWRVHDGYRDKGGHTEIIDGVTVRRVRHYVPERPSPRGRVLMEASFAQSAARSNWGNPSAVLTVSPSLLASAAVATRAKVSRIPVGVIVQDLYSRAVVETNAMGGRGAAATTRFEIGLLNSVAGVSVIHDRFCEVLTRLGVDGERITVIRNWTHHTVPLIEATSIAAVREKYGWRQNEVVVVHAGNMGVKQGLENVVVAARLAEDSKAPVRFVLLGDGNQRRRLEADAMGLNNIQFVDPVPNAEFVGVLSAADVLVVNEKPDVVEMAVPSKLTSYFISGRPVLAATSAGSATASEVGASGAGVVIGPGDPASLLAAARRLGEDRAAGARFGDAGRRYAKSMLSRQAAIDRYEQWCRRLRDMT